MTRSLHEICKDALAKIGPNGYFPDIGYPLTKEMREAVAATPSAACEAAIDTFKAELINELTKWDLADVARVLEKSGEYSYANMIARLACIVNLSEIADEPAQPASEGKS